MKKKKKDGIIKFMLIMLLIFCLGQVFAAECGDVNSNGDIDIIDALLISQSYVGLNPANYDSSVADVNADNSINIVDALLVAQYYVRLISQLSCSNTTPAPTAPPSGGENSMGYCGCSMAENVANGYRTVGGRRMWGGYGTGGMVVQNWTNPNSSSWQLFDRQANQYGTPDSIWVQVCIFSQGATYDEVKQMIAAARQHISPEGTIYISGQPLYPEGNVCFLAGGADGPSSTDRLAQQAGDDPSQNVTYIGTFTLRNSEVADGCHANSSGEQALGYQAVEKFGQ